MSVQNPDLQPIIIKKVIAHGGHHGGAWKVAYADFVTAMMALFIVLWLMSSSSKVKEAVAGYFREEAGSGSQTGSGTGGTGDGVAIGRNDMQNLKEKLEAAVKRMPELAALKDQVAMTVTGEGLRVELLESDIGTFFESGNSKPSTSGTDMLKLLAAELGKMQNKILIEGHTDSRQFANADGYSNWELSSDRANAARRLMQSNGMRVDQVAEVRGYADQKLREPAAPEAAANRRVSIIVKYREPPPGQEPAAGEHREPAKPSPAANAHAAH